VNNNNEPFGKSYAKMWASDVVGLNAKAVMHFILSWGYAQDKRLSSTYIAVGLNISSRTVKRSIKELMRYDWIRIAKTSCKRKGYVYAARPDLIVTDKKETNDINVKKYNDAKPNNWGLSDILKKMTSVKPKAKKGHPVTNKVPEKHCVKTKKGQPVTNNSDNLSPIIVTKCHTNKNINKITNPEIEVESKESGKQLASALLGAQAIAPEVEVEGIIQAWNFNNLKNCEKTESEIQLIREHLKSDKFKKYNRQQHLKAFLDYSKQLKTNRDQIKEFSLKEFFDNDFALRYYSEETKPITLKEVSI